MHFGIGILILTGNLLPYIFLIVNVFCVFIFSNHVLTEDVVHREIKDGKLISKRLLTKTNSGISVPKWGERFMISKQICIVEESIVDPEHHIIVSYTRNLGLTKIMVSICLYKNDKISGNFLETTKLIVTTLYSNINFS